ncbi:hypothetical protein [Peptoniphilus timonensis]|uniref:hypothetical protein n=1 Tax=Peptoniphilus timonensis TaxID=1268254 RepID=UPI0002D76C14|nr:hypothetical protein [Peptoniphilus timonensis]
MKFFNAILIVALWGIPIAMLLFLTKKGRLKKYDKFIVPAFIFLVIGMVIHLLFGIGILGGKEKKVMPIEESKIQTDADRIEESKKETEKTNSLSAEDKKQLGFSPTISPDELSKSLSADPSKRYIIYDEDIYSLRTVTKETLEERKNKPDEKIEDPFVYGKGKLNGKPVYYFREESKNSSSDEGLGNVKAYPEDIVVINHISDSYTPSLTKTYKVIQTANSIIKQLIKVSANIPENSVMEDY